MVESTNNIYDMILGRDLLIALVLDIKFSENVMIGSEGPYEGCFVTMVDVINYEFTSITDKTVRLEGSFINLYVNECLKSNNAIISTHSMRIILDAKYEFLTLIRL